MNAYLIKNKVDGGYLTRILARRIKSGKRRGQYEYYPYYTQSPQLLNLTEAHDIFRNIAENSLNYLVPDLTVECFKAVLKKTKSDYTATSLFDEAEQEILFNNLRYENLK